MRLLRLAAAVVAVSAAACSSPATSSATSAGSDLVGGQRDLTLSAAGYLVQGASLADVDTSKPACGATLIAPNVVVTAAHCVLRSPNATWAFGTGDVGSGALTRVSETHVDPEFHAAPEGTIDIPYALRKNDVAYLILESAVAGVTPAALPTADPASACDVQAYAYHDDADGDSVRMSTPACVVFHLSLGDDPIFEVHPAQSSGLCNADGDEGSAVMSGTSDAPVLVGFYVGSVTQFATDCDADVQFTDGYESAYGYRDFFGEAIARGAQVLAQ